MDDATSNHGHGWCKDLKSTLSPLARSAGFPACGFGHANRAAGDGTLAGGSGRLPFPLVASGASRITSIPEPPIPGGPRIKFEPTHVGCYGLIGGVVRVTHRLIMPARCRRHAKRILGRCPTDRGQ